VVLPAERNERWLWRISLTVLIVIILYIVFWVVRNASTSLNRIHKAYNVDTGRAPIVELS
jgi:hypothetical protein